MEAIHLLIVNIFYQNVPSSIKVPSQCELKTGLLSRIRPSIQIKVLARVIATDQWSALTSLGWDSLVTLFLSLSYR